MGCAILMTTSAIPGEKLCMGSAIPNITLPNFCHFSRVAMLNPYLEAATSGSTSGQSSNEAFFGIGAVCTGALQ